MASLPPRLSFSTQSAPKLAQAANHRLRSGWVGESKIAPPARPRKSVALTRTESIASASLSSLKRSGRPSPVADRAWRVRNRTQSR